MRRYPEMSGGRFHNGYASLYDLTSDWQPIVGALPGLDGLYGSLGSSGHGFKLAPIIGRIVAQLVLGEETDRDALDLFAFDRFDQGARADGRYAGHKILG
jgi:glycine/D-amino acid oxidase-like deaminating enzyme